MEWSVSARRQMVLMGQLSYARVSELLEPIQQALEDGPLEILLTSTGGNVEASLSLVNLMKAYQGSRIIRVIGLGNVESSALLVLAAGTPGERYMLGDSVGLVHEIEQSFDSIRLPTTRWEDWMAYARNLQDRYWQTLAGCSGQAPDFWKTFERRDYQYLLPGRLKELGVIDHHTQGMPAALV